MYTRSTTSLAVLAALPLLVGCADRAEPSGGAGFEAEAMADSVPAVAIPEPRSDTVMARDTATGVP
jgi:hypothetical protein